MKSDEHQNTPWVCSGSDEAHEDMLIGNREGFLLLKRKIDQALESGSSVVEEAGIEWNQVKIVEADPRQKKFRVRDWIPILFLGAGILLILFLVVIGFGTLKSWWQ